MNLPLPTALHYDCRHLQGHRRWIDQPAAGLKDINDSELSNIRVKALWQASDNLSVKGTVIRHRNDFGAQNYVNIEPISDSNFRRGGGLEDQPGQTNISNYDIYNLTANYDFGFASLVSSSSKLEQEVMEETTGRELVGDLTVDVLCGHCSRQFDVFPQDLRLTSNDNGGRAHWTVGVFYSDLELEATNESFFWDQSDGFSADFGAFPFEESSESIAYYVDLAYDLSDRLTAGFGSRYFEDDQTTQAMWEGANQTLQQGTFDKLSSRVYLSYSLSDDANLYGSISEGFRSGGFNAVDVPPFDPETVLAYEVGLKSNLLDNRLRSNIALYYSDYKDIIDVTFNNEEVFASSTNLGEAVVKGIEFDLEWIPSQHLLLSISGSWTDAEITKVGSTLEVPANNEGDSLNSIPEYELSASAEYSFDWSGDIAGSFYLAYDRQGETQETVRSAGFLEPVVRNGAFGFLSAKLSAEWQHIQASLFARNLLDEDTLLNANHTSLAAQARPRTIGAEFTYNF